MPTAAVIGTGFIGPVHVEALRRAGVHVAGVLGSSLDKGRAAAEQLGIPKAYSDLSELVSDRSLDAVHIASPNKAHFEQAKLCLQAGLHVLCEKPLAMNSEESHQLVQLAQRSGRAAGVNYNIRYYPLCLEAAERIRDDKLGNVHYVAGSYTQDWLFHPTDFNWRILADQAGPLRAVADIGTHWLDLIYAITGLEVESVCADLQTVFPTRSRPAGGAQTFSDSSVQPEQTEPVTVDTEDFGAVLLRFRAPPGTPAARGVLYVSQVTAGRKNSLRWEVAGTKQALSWESEQPNQLWIGHRDHPNQTLTRDPALLQGRATQFSDYPGGHNEGFPDTFKQLFRDFYQSIEKQTYDSAPTFPNFADGHREILICEAIMRSARENAWAHVQEQS